jgi:hypothetical protein
MKNIQDIRSYSKASRFKESTLEEDFISAGKGLAKGTGHVIAGFRDFGQAIERNVIQPVGNTIGALGNIGTEQTYGERFDVLQKRDEQKEIKQEKFDDKIEKEYLSYNNNVEEIFG